MTLREETEWVELVIHGFNKLVSADVQDMTKKYQESLSSKIDWNKNLYGHGKSSQDIVKELVRKKIIS